MSSLESARHLVTLGLHLLPIPRGEKMSRVTGWKQLENLASTLDRVETLFGGRQLNIGVCLGPSGIISLDVDNLEQARRILDELGIDLDALTSRHPHPIQARGQRYWFRMPEGFEYGGVRQWKFPDTNGESQMAFELRTGDGAQDVAPGSLHPAGMPYVWSKTPPRVREDLPECPPELLALYQQRQRKTKAPNRSPASPGFIAPMQPGQGSVVLPPLLSIAQARTREATCTGGRLDSEDVRAWMGEHVDMENLLRCYGYQFDGPRVQCPHPDHNDTNPSALYHSTHTVCMACRKAVDPIGLVMHREGLSYRQAVVRLGYTPPTRPEDSQKRREQAQTRAAAPRLKCPPQNYTELIAHAATALQIGRTATARQGLAYLQQRGFEEGELELLALGITDEETPAELLPKCWTRDGRLITFADWQALWRGRIIIPDPRSDGLCVKGRDILGRDVSKKYVLATGFFPGVFNAEQAAQRPGPLLVVEGEMDCMSVMVGLPEQAVMGVPGVSALTPEACAELGLAGRRVLLMLDRDADLLRAARLGARGGTQNGAKRTLEVLRDAGADVWLVPALQAFNDVNEAFAVLPRPEFRDLLTARLRDYARPLVRSRMIS